jgi:hypothetical protein
LPQRGRAPSGGSFDAARPGVPEARMQLLLLAGVGEVRGDLTFALPFLLLND